MNNNWPEINLQVGRENQVIAEEDPIVNARAHTSPRNEGETRTPLVLVLLVSCTCNPNYLELGDARE